jgi:hypothetical protein
VDEPADRLGPRVARGRAPEALELGADRVRDRDPDAGEPARDLDRATPTGLDRRGNGRPEIVEERLRLDLDAVPVGPAGELAELLDPLGGLGRRDPELLELADLLLDLLLQRLGRLPPLLERLRLLLQDAGEAG